MGRDLRLILIAVLIGAIILVFAACGAVLVGWDWEPSRSMPSDRELIDNLGEHRSQFEELVRMLEHDQRLRAIYFDSIDPGLRAAHVTKRRVERYRDLMRSTGVDEDIQRIPGAGTISFRVAYEGSVLSSDDRGYVYSTKQLQPLFDSLDHDEAVARTAYRRIGGNWYLYRWIDP